MMGQPTQKLDEVRWFAKHCEGIATSAALGECLVPMAVRVAVEGCAACLEDGSTHADVAMGRAGGLSHDKP